MPNVSPNANVTQVELGVALGLICITLQALRQVHMDFGTHVWCVRLFGYLHVGIGNRNISC